MRRLQWIAGDLHVRIFFIGRLEWLSFETDYGFRMRIMDIFLRKIQRTTMRLFLKHIPETQFTTPISRTIFLFPTEPSFPLMIAGFQSAQAFIQTNSDHVHKVRTRRSTERSTARLFQGSSSLARSQTCQHHTPPTVDRR